MHCGDCRFWHQPETQCRRNAPMPTHNPQGNKHMMWPQVAAEEWCGEYQPGYIDRTEAVQPTGRKAGAQGEARH